MNIAMSNLQRFARILWICAHHLVAHSISRQFNRYSFFRRLKLIESHSGPQRLRMTLQQIGGTFIKFGQVLALQSDILPLDYCRELFNLLDRVPPFPFEDVENTFLRELGRKPLEIYDSFARDPIATGSIAQVHVAMLGRQKLAVKVRRPSVLTDFVSDIRLMMFTVNLIAALRIKALYWMIAPTTEFVAWTREELDFRREARYMDAIAKNAIGNPREAVPRVLWKYTTECLLSSEFLEALTVLDYMRARDARDVAVLRRFESISFDPSTFARNLIDNFLGDAFQYGMFHADLHPANLMVMPSSRVGYIDFGIAGVLSTYSRQHLVAMTLAYARGDLDHMCDSFFQVSTMDGRSRPDAFRARLKEMSRNWYIRDGEGVDLRKSITAIMLELLTISRETNIWPQRDVVKYIRSAIALDGLIKSLAPGFNVGHHLESVCDRHLHWHSLRNLMSPGTAFGWLEAGFHLARDGMSRTIGMMGQLLSPASSASSESVRRPTGFAVVRIAAVALLASILAVAPRGAMTWGLNPRSASASLAGAAVLLALWRISRAPGTGDHVSSAPVELPDVH
jgi:predicted unusual protein kinase regulating ubiquinone biosynthesis (AarF/ABC1/UbiB family)